MKILPAWTLSVLPCLKEMSSNELEISTWFCGGCHGSSTFTTPVGSGIWAGVHGSAWVVTGNLGRLYGASWLTTDTGTGRGATMGLDSSLGGDVVTTCCSTDGEVVEEDRCATCWSCCGVTGASLLDVVDSGKLSAAGWNSSSSSELSDSLLESPPAFSSLFASSAT